MKKHVVITGGAKGMGESAVRIFIREDYRVTILDIDSEAGSKLSQALGDDVLFIKCDMANEEMIKKSFSKAIAHFGEISILVNNVGIVIYGTVTTTTSEDWDLNMNINLKSYFLCSKEAIPSIQKIGKGVIINVSSVQAYLSQSSVAAYTTGKTALLGLTRSIAVDYAPDIRCVAICPSTIDTPMLQRALKESPNPQAVLDECNNMHLLERIGTADEVGELIVFAASDKGGFMTGQAIRVDGGIGIKVAGSKQD